MAATLTDAGLRRLKPEPKTYQRSDGGGLFIEVSATGTKAWRLKYRLGGKHEKITLGTYPNYGLSDARRWRADCKRLLSRGLSPMRIKQGEQPPSCAPSDAPALVEAFVRDWCQTTKHKREAQAATDTVSGIAAEWLTAVVTRDNANPRNIERALRKDILPAIGHKIASEVTKADVLQIVSAIKARGSDQMALATRNIMKRLFAYAIGIDRATFNPAAAVEAKYIAVAKSRDVALSADEIGRLLRAVYTSEMRRAYKLAVHLLVLTMVRKRELTEAPWSEIDLSTATWVIPGARMKKERDHVVYLSRQAVAMVQELQDLAHGSPWVIPGRKPSNHTSHNTLNNALAALDCDVRNFVLHDFRRTASTHLHEAGFSPDWIEKCLAHEGRGVRAVYNRAQYADQRREMLQWWADFVDAQIDEGRKVIIGRFGKEYRSA